MYVPGMEIYRRDLSKATYCSTGEDNKWDYKKREKKRGGGSNLISFKPHTTWHKKNAVTQNFLRAKTRREGANSNQKQVKRSKTIRVLVRFERGLGSGFSSYTV